jgi:hypothetical protein
VRAPFLAVAIASLLAAAVGCSSSSSSTSNQKNLFGGDGGSDGAQVRHDAGHSTSKDAGHLTSRDGGQSTHDAATGHDAGVDTGGKHKDAGSPCGSAALTGQMQQEEQTIGAIPTPTGGTIAPGTYLLRAMFYYPDTPEAGVALSPDVAQKTIIFGTTTYSFAQAVGTIDAGLGAESLSGGTYTTSGTTLTLTAVCPTPGTTTYTFSATAASLSLYSGEHEEDYQLQVLLDGG